MSGQIPFCPYKPTDKQDLFLNCEDKEVFFGGAAGGGKSVALLMAALKYVGQPGYAALILRKDLPRLELPGGLIPLSHEWFSGKEGVRWNAKRHTWIFETSAAARPATITFGYLSRPLDIYRYASSEFQYIAFDELTDFAEEDYTFLFSRLRRRNKWPQADVRMRSASNPCGAGRLWVKQRFIDGAVSLEKSPQKFVKEKDRCYIPSRLEDNEHLAAAEYRDSLANLPPVEREQLLSGNWDIQADGVFKQKWLRYYVQGPGQVELLRACGGSLATIADELASFERFITIDPASTPEAEARRRRSGREPSWSVIQVWDQPKQHPQFLLLRDQWRQRVDLSDLCDQIPQVAGQWRVKRIYIEHEATGRAAISHLKNTVHIIGLPTGGRSKEERSEALQNKLKRGEVFLPKTNNGWLDGFQAELLAWTGDEHQPADQIDAAAYAAIIAEAHSGGAVKVQSAVVVA